MASISDRIITLEGQVRKLLATVSSFQGQPTNATFSVPHNDSWIFEDNVDSTHAANLRYIISKNVTRVVSARLSIFMASYRTYNNFSATVTGTESATHSHAQGNGAVNTDSTPLQGGLAAVNPIYWPGSHQIGIATSSGVVDNITTNGHNHAQGTSGTESATHTHSIVVNSTLGVTEGATATGVTVAFDGADATAALGGPFNADVIELDVRRFIQVTTGVKHTIAMQPSGNGRIEAHLRLGVYVSAENTL